MEFGFNDMLYFLTMMQMVGRLRVKKGCTREREYYIATSLMKEDEWKDSAIIKSIVDDYYSDVKHTLEEETKKVEQEIKDKKVESLV